jgi:Ser/Thr protein kinase RdoA (MazF antagonist)
MAHAVTLKAVQGKFVDAHYDGPFILQHTDIHASNIFVDEDWNITAVIDMEFVCVLPPQMLEIPYWLSVDYIDDVVENMDNYTKTYEAFMQILDEEQRQMPLRHAISIATEIRNAWCSGAHWFYHCLTSVNATPSIVEDHIYPRFGYHASLGDQTAFMKALSHFWAEDSAYWVRKKVAEKQQYDVDLKAQFEST